MKSPERVVFDCNVFFQAFISVSGPAGELLKAVSDKSLSLFLSEFVLDELKDVLSRPHIVSQFKFTSERVAVFLELLVEIATMAADVPHVFEFPRDPKDAHYVDLALAVDAKLIVSRDKDLLSLRDPATSEGRDFMSRYPALVILTPPEVLKLLATTSPPE
jgi:putative PIN family toxin of toxin-antitoxin system